MDTPIPRHDPISCRTVNYSHPHEERPSPYHYQQRMDTLIYTIPSIFIFNQVLPLSDERALLLLCWWTDAPDPLLTHTHTYSHTHPLDGRLLCLSIHVHGTHWKNQHAARHSATGNDIHRCLDDWPSRPPPFGLFNSVGIRTEWEGNVAPPANFHSTNFQIQPPNNVSRYWYCFAPVRFTCHPWQSLGPVTQNAWVT